MDGPSPCQIVSRRKQHQLTMEERNGYLSVRGTIFDIQRFSIHDGPGIRTIVFIKGCPLRCAWCCNPESQSHMLALMFTRTKCIRCGACEKACPLGAISFGPDAYPLVDRAMCDGCGQCVDACCTEALHFDGCSRSVREIAVEVLKDRAFYENSGGGLTLSGGEAMSQPDFAYALLAIMKDEGLHTVLETAGAVPSATLMRMLPLLDLVLYDVKHYDPVRHQQETGFDNRLVLANLKALCDCRQPLIVRIPVIPGFNDARADAIEFGRLLNAFGIQEVNLLPFHQLGEGKYGLLGIEYAYKGLKGLTDEDLADYRLILEQYVPRVSIGG